MTVRGFGRTYQHSLLCDVDHACDGICTFAFEDRYAECLVRKPFTRHCPPSIGELTSAPGLAPCPSGVPHYALTWESQTSTRRVVKHGGVRFMLRCLANASCGTTTTSTLPPGLRDYSGDWEVTIAPVRNDCPAGLEGVVNRPSQLMVVQQGTRLSGCGAISTSKGTVSESGFVLALKPNCCFYNGSMGRGARLSREFQATIDGKRMQVVDRWDLVPLPPLSPQPCEIVAWGTMERLVTPCQNDRECLERVDTCSRCIGGTCIRRPGCL